MTTEAGANDGAAQPGGAAAAAAAMFEQSGGGSGAGGGAGASGGGAGSGAGSGGGAAPAGAAGAPGAAPANGDAGQAGGAKPFWDSFGLSAEKPDADTLADAEWIANKNFANPEALIKAYRNLEKAKPVTVPKGADDAEGRRAALTAMGWPADAAAYDIPVPEGDDGSFAEAFRPEAHKLGLLPDQVKGLVEWYNQTATARADLDVSGAKASLEKEWGAGFAENNELARRGREMLNLDNDAVAGIASGYGLAATVKLMAQIGRSIGEAGGLPGGGGGGFAKTADQLEARKQEILTSPELRQKLNARDPALTAEWAAINAADGEKMKAMYQS